MASPFSETWDIDGWSWKWVNASKPAGVLNNIVGGRDAWQRRWRFVTWDVFEKGPLPKSRPAEILLTDLEKHLGSLKLGECYDQPVQASLIAPEAFVYVGYRPPPPLIWVQFRGRPIPYSDQHGNSYSKRWIFEATGDNRELEFRLGHPGYFGERDSLVAKRILDSVHEFYAEFYAPKEIEVVEELGPTSLVDEDDDTDQSNDSVAREERGWIYVMDNESFPDLVKIGYTTGPTAERAKELSQGSGVPSEFVVRYDVEAYTPAVVEKFVHRMARPWRFRENREFFQLTVAQARELIQTALEVQQGKWLAGDGHGGADS